MNEAKSEFPALSSISLNSPLRTPPIITLGNNTTISLIALILLLSGNMVAHPQEISKGDTVTLIAVGDVSLARRIGAIIDKNPSFDPFGKVSHIFKSADSVFCNLESVLCSKALKPVNNEKPYNLSASAFNSRILKNAGINIVSLSNNHIMDYGAAGLNSTCSSLTDSEIQYFGAGKNLAIATEALTIRIKNMNFAFLGYTDGMLKTDFADADTPGIAIIELERIKKDIATVRIENDVIVVSLHWGHEYSNVPTEKQKQVARSIIDYGADIIIGHHPHVLQGVESYKGKYIFYSLGNFLFDQNKSGTESSLIAAFAFRDKRIVNVKLIPISRHNKFFPEIAQGNKKTKISNKILEYSKSAGLDIGPIMRFLN